MLLEKELALELNETIELKREIDKSIADKADKNKENGIAIDKQMVLLDKLNSWMDEQEAAESSKRQAVLLKNGNTSPKQLTRSDMEHTSLKLAYDNSKPEIA